jgi:hypothetical protein
LAEPLKVACEYNCRKASKIDMNTTASKFQKKAGNSKFMENSNEKNPPTIFPKFLINIIR